ncbi:DUF7167 family protein [Effusibacillus dendaii]|uniref:DUF7167 domain-containing protein n=1 Tax=Effusibacillus dendaii TaxID=2743772 RepID=A0A7I8D8K9_9BACL|nr:hypothetical protein [Effusibacillus dendaii]BCJ86483.1 hypothetical protein skT53_14680 [Effusibacillus dendaii]
MAKFVFFCNTGFAGANHREIIEIPDEELVGLSDDEKQTLLQEAVEEWVWSKIDVGFCEVGEDDEEYGVKRE